MTQIYYWGLVTREDHLSLAITDVHILQKRRPEWFRTFFQGEEAFLTPERVMRYFTMQSFINLAFIRDYYQWVMP